MDEEPVEILLGMAERGEVNPWKIDIVDVTDRFLSEVDRRKELDLRISGRTLFYAACLLRLKSDYIDGWEEDIDEESSLGDEDEFFGDLDFDFEYGEDADPIERLEREIQRRLGRRNMRKRPPVTLYELIKELKTAEKAQRRKQRRRRPAPPREPEPDLSAEEVVAVAHDEGYREAVTAVMGTFRQVAENGDVLTLGDLAGAMGWTRREVYIPLLFLMLEGKLVLWQEEFFGEVYVADHIPDGAGGLPVEKGRVG